MNISSLLFIILIQFYLICASDISQIELVPKLGQVVNNARRNVNTSLQVTCGVEQGAQPLFFEWFKNGQSIKAVPGVKWQIETSTKFSTLNIDRIDKEDGGNYSCLVKNIHGSDSIHVLLTVKGILELILTFFCICPRKQRMALLIP